MPRALLFINTKASQAEGAYEQAEACLQAGGMEVIRGKPCDADDYARCVREAGELDLIIAGGGDGTLVCAAKGVLAHPDHPVPVGILPLGTANNVARSLGIPFGIPEACKVILDGRTMEMDLAKVNGRLFVSVAGMGLSTRVHAEVPSEMKRRLGALAYAFHAAKLLIKRPPSFHAEIRSDEGTTQLKALQLTVVNGRYYGAHVEVHPEARLDEGLLDMSVIEARAYLRGMFKALLPLPAGHRSPGLQLLRSKKFTVTTVPTMNIDVEGSTDLQTPAHFEVLPKALRVFAP